MADIKHPMRYFPRQILSAIVLLWFSDVPKSNAVETYSALREYATFETDLGNIEFELFSQAAPQTVANFKYLADTRFYDGTAFHRIIDGFMAQGGDPYTRANTLFGAVLTEGTQSVTFESFAGPLPIDYYWGMTVSGSGIVSNTTALGFSYNTNYTGALGSAQFGVYLSTSPSISSPPYIRGKKDQRITLSLGSLTSAAFGGGGPGYSIPDEFSRDSARSHSKGVLSMANAGTVNSGGSGFFLMLADNSGLDDQYASFAKITDEQENLDTLASFAEIAKRSTLNPYAQVDYSRNIPSGPSQRTVLKSVRIRSEITSGTIGSGYPAGAFSGLLRNHNRQDSPAKSVLGRYNITLTSNGLFSGLITYFARQISFTGKLKALNSSGTENECVVILDQKSLVPLKLTIHLRRTSPTGGNLSVVVCSLNPDGTDETDATMATGATDSTRPSLASDRFTTTLSTENNSGSFSDIRGYGLMTVRYLQNTGICNVSAKLPDNRSLTYSSVAGTEGIRKVLPIYILEASKALSSQQSQFGTVSQFQWPLLQDPVDFPFVLRGEVELTDTSKIPPTNTTPKAKYLYWLRNNQTTGAIRHEISGHLYPRTAPWTRPASNTFPAPFLATSGTANIQVGTVAAGTFTLSKSTGTATFRPNANALSLKLNTTDGTFSGTFLDKSKGTAVRRTFQGVCLGGGSFLMRGFYTDENSVKSVDITIPQ